MEKVTGTIYERFAYVSTAGSLEVYYTSPAFYSKVDLLRHIYSIDDNDIAEEDFIQKYIGTEEIRYKDFTRTFITFREIQYSNEKGDTYIATLDKIRKEEG